MKFIFLFIFISAFAQAQNCEEVNLITASNSPFAKIPVTDQNGSGMCYAYVSSQLMNYELIRSGQASSQVVHPAWAGVSFGRKDGQLELRGGYVDKTVNAILERGNCNYEAVHGAIRSWAGSTRVSEAKILAFIDDYSRHYRQNLRRGPDNVSTRKASFRQAAAENGQCNLSDWERIFGSKPEFLAQSAIDITDRLLAPQCPAGQLSHLDLPQIKKVNSGDDRSIENKIDNVLKGGRPLAMTFCSWAADRKATNPPMRNVALNPNGYRISTDDSEDACGSHVALIAGQKKIGNTCNYLYRNSRGNRWFKDNQHLTCLCRNKRTGEYVDECKATTHSNREYSVEACWVPAPHLVPNIFSLTHF